MISKILLKEFGKLNLKLIIYPSSADAMLAIERKEADGNSFSLNSGTGVNAEIFSFCSSWSKFTMDLPNACLDASGIL